MNDLKNDMKDWLECGREVLMGRFIEYGGQRTIHRGEGDVEFVYIPGTRSNRVLLVAHTDTVWDSRAGFPASVVYQDGVFRSGVPHQGIGADDRAGCAMLWHLRDLGHSLLLTSGEELGCLGSYWIMAKHEDIATEIQQHQFLVQFDRSRATDYKCYNVGTPDFRHYIEIMTGYQEPNRFSSTDIVVLANDVCGVNISIGYYLEHTPHEILVLEEWHNTYTRMRHWLSTRYLPRFPLRQPNLIPSPIDYPWDPSIPLDDYYRE